MSVTVKSECATARRRLQAASRRLDGVAGLFTDLDGYLESYVDRRIAEIKVIIDQIDREMRETVAEGGAS